MTNEAIQKAADLIYEAHRSGTPCAPVRDLIGLSVEAGYAVQELNTRRWVEGGRRLVGRKIGLTSLAVQQQLGVDQPDFGVLFADMEFADGAEIPLSMTQQAKAEGEIAFVMSRDLTHEDVTVSELIRAVDYIVPAIEIVGSRIANWDIRISDTIADNASAGLYVLGGPVRSLRNVDLADARMILKCQGQARSYGAGVACLGNPLNAALWLARTCARNGSPLRAGDVVLTGALGPMVTLAAGDHFEAEISGVGTVRASITAG